MTPARISRGEFLCLAKIADHAERYEDALALLKGINNTYDDGFTLEERSLLSIAYKNITNTQRSAWRVVDTIEKMEAKRAGADPHRVRLIRAQRRKIERELSDTCADLVGMINSRLLPRAKRGEETVFYWKMKGDYYRYLVELTSGAEQNHFADLSLDAYKYAYKHAISTLPAAHPTRLGLALNFAVYYHDVRNSPERACHLARHAFNEAIESVHDQAPQTESFRDALMILQLLKDDLILWSKELKD